MNDNRPEEPTGPQPADQPFDWGVTAPVEKSAAAVPPGEAGFAELDKKKPGKTGKPSKRTLLWWVIGGLVGLVIAIGSYVAISATAGGGAASPSPTPTAEPTAPAAIGQNEWSVLFGGECINDFENAWQESFDVVDCAEPHEAQLVYRGDLAGDEAAAYPGEEELANITAESCVRPGIINANVASGYADLQIQTSFPVTEEQWTESKRYFYCFVDRSSGELIDESLTGSGPAS